MHQGCFLPSSTSALPAFLFSAHVKATSHGWDTFTAQSLTPNLVHIRSSFIPVISPHFIQVFASAVRTGKARDSFHDGALEHSGSRVGAKGALEI